MANKFQFKLFTSSDPQAQYDALTTKDDYTFYLLKNGVGYLGNTKLFDASADSTNLVTNMLGENYTGDNASVASTKAIVDYVTAKVSNVSGVLTSAFFRKVESHTITTEDLSNPAISVPEGTTEGDVGLLFTADTDGENGGETYFFISLKNYLQNVYTTENTNSIEMNITPDNKIKANLKIKSGENSVKIDEDNGGVYLEKTATINETPSEDKLVTEKALVDYITNKIVPAVNQSIADALKDVVTYSVDDNISEPQS